MTCHQNWMYSRQFWGIQCISFHLHTHTHLSFLLTKYLLCLSSKYCLVCNNQCSTVNAGYWIVLLLNLWCVFSKWCNRDPRCKKLQLTDLLVAPVQHIMKVPLILKEVETRTEDSAEREQITQILEIEENSISKYPASFDMLTVLF